jgi:hypothetical protein
MIINIIILMDTIFRICPDDSIQPVDSTETEWIRHWIGAKIGVLR